MKAKFLVLVLLSMCISVLSLYAQDESYQLSSHILDINTGYPAANVKISLYKQNSDGDWAFVEAKVTDQNGRIKDFLPYTQDNRGIYKLTYHVGPYFESQRQNSFYPLKPLSSPGRRSYPCQKASGRHRSICPHRRRSSCKASGQ